jgi:D-arginine dehydrogenase
MFDVVIIGGGVLGTTAALEAHARHPNWSIALADSAPGHGATRWSLGVNFPLAPTPAHRPLVQESLRWYLAWSRQPTPRRLVRMLFVVDKARKPSFLSQFVGSPFSSATPDLIDEAQEAWSLQLGEDDEVLVGDDRVFQIDAPLLVRQLISAAGPVMIDSRVETLTRERDTSILSLSDGSSIAAERVVVATGPWYPNGLGKQLGIPPGVVVKRVSALECDLQRMNAPAVYFIDDDLMIVPDMRSERVLVSFYRQAWNDDPETLTGTPSPADIAEGKKILLRRSPSLAAAVVGGRSFCDAYAPQRIPITGAAGPGLVTVVGGSGSGVRLAPALASMAIRSLERTGRAEVV